MPFCPFCGTESRDTQSFCVACGRPIADFGNRPSQTGAVALSELDYVIPQARVVLLTVLTNGLYLFYWGYITWKQYRNILGEQRGGQNFPVWHSLSLGVPIYGLFRFHAHIRSFKELMDSASVPSTLSPGSAVGFIIVSQVVAVISAFLVDGVSDQESGKNFAVAILLLNALSVAIVASVLNQAQDNINRYWTSLPGGHWSEARVGKGEVVLSMLGILLWGDTLLSVFSASYRGL